MDDFQIIQVGRRRCSTMDKLFSFILILLPLLYQYRGLGNVVSLGEILILPFVVIYFIDEVRSRKSIINKQLLLIYISTTLSIVLCVFMPYFEISDALTLYSRMLFYGLLILVSRKHFYYEVVSEFYQNAVLVCALYAIMQYIYHQVSGGYLPVYLRYDLLFPAEARGANLADYRVSGFFLEPSYFVLYSFPAMVELVVTNKKYVRFLIIAAAILLSGSSSGVVGILIIFWFSYLAHGEKNLFLRIKYLLTSAIAIIAAVILGLTQSSISRITSGGSFENRITNGILIFIKLPLYHQIVGTGLNNAGNAMTYYHISTGINMWGSANDYCASLFAALNYQGIIGLLAIVILIISYFKDSSSLRTKCLVVLLMFTLSYEAVLFTYRFAFYLVLIEAFILEDKYSMDSI